MTGRFTHRKEQILVGSGYPEYNLQIPQHKKSEVDEKQLKRKGEKLFSWLLLLLFFVILHHLWDFSSLTRDRNWALSSESAKSQPLNHNKSPEEKVFLKSVVNG